MTSVTIFGSGNMGSAIDEVLTAGGATVDHIGSADPPGPVNGDIVILAVYHTAFRDIVDKYGDKLAGKIVVDITNPLDPETFDSLVPPPHSSSAAILPLRCLRPGTQGVQHEPCAHTQHPKKVGPDTTTVLVAGDDADAKAALISAVQAGGLDALDTGPLAALASSRHLDFFRSSSR